MDKQTLLEKIRNSKITPELKSQLEATVNAASAVDQGLISQISQAIDAEAEGLIEEIANAELQVETDKYNQQIQAVGDQVDDFVKQVNQKADQIDLEEARKKVA